MEIWTFVIKRDYINFQENKRKSRFADAPSSDIEIIKSSSKLPVSQQQDDYIGFTPPDFQISDTSQYSNFNSSLYQPVSEVPMMTENEHYQQLWNEYRSEMGSKPVQYPVHVQPPAISTYAPPVQVYQTQPLSFQPQNAVNYYNSVPPNNTHTMHNSQYMYNNNNR